MPEPKTVNMTANGRTVVVPIDMVAEAERQGFVVEDASAKAERLSAEFQKEEHSGIASGLGAMGLGALRTATLGGSDALLEGLYGEGEHLSQLREARPGMSVAGEILGGVTGVGPAGLVTRGAARIAKAAEGAGTLTRLGRAAAGGAFEGAATGAGQTISELALSGDPLTMERIGSSLSSNLLLGGGIGGAAGALAKGVEIGLTKGGAALKRAADRAEKASNVSDDLASLDIKGLNARDEVELDRLVAVQKADQETKRAAAADQALAYYKQVGEDQPWRALGDGKDAAEFTGADKVLRRAEGNRVGLARNPAKVEDALQREGQALENAIARRAEIHAEMIAGEQKLAAKLAEDVAALAEGGTLALKGKAAKRYASYTGQRAPKEGFALNRDAAQGFIDALSNGEIAGARSAAAAKLDGLLEMNRAAQRAVADASAAPIAKADLTSPLRSSIKDARDLLTSGGGGKKTLAEQMAGGAVFGAVTGVASAIPFVGPFMAPFLGAKAASYVGEKVFGRMAKTSAEAAMRTTKAVDAFVGAVKKASPVAPVLATKVLSAVRYAPPGEDEPKKKAKKSKVSLPEVFQARADEIRSQVEPGVDGRPVMRREARARVAERLGAVAAKDPRLADQLETVAARRIEFLASKLPRKSDLSALALGPDLHRFSDMEMRTFARYAAAVEDPGAIEERVADGTLTPEDVETMQIVYPERLAELQRQIMERLPDLQETLPYHRRLSLSMLTGMPVDRAMHPEILGLLQGHFAEEAGTEGGMQAPRAAPQFGSVSKSAPKPTPAQERAG